MLHDTAKIFPTHVVSLQPGWIIQQVVDFLLQCVELISLHLHLNVTLP